MVSSTTSTTAPTAAATGSSIVSSLGGGSGIDSAALIQQLTELSAAGDTQRLATRKTSLETQISDFGLMRSAIDKLNTAVLALGNADTFNAKAVSIPDTSLLTVNKLGADAAAGDYRLQVQQLAQAQSISSGVFSSASDPVGKGTLTIRFGDWSSDLSTFNVNADVTGATITIDDSNNSLTGLRDAINKAGIGVQASIVSDSGGYKLLLTAPSGATHEMELSVTEDAGSAGLSAFDFNQTTQNLNQQQEGLDAKVSVNGLVLTRSSNHMTDVISGLEFDIFNSSPTETVSLSISQDKSAAETAVRNFVEAYNTFLSDTSTLVGYDAEKGDFGSLHQDPLAKGLLASIRSSLGTPIAAAQGDFNTLGSIGIRTKIDGTLEIIEDGTNTDFKSALTNHYEAVRDLFVPKTSIDNSAFTVKGFSSASQSGSYAVNITAQPSKGYLNGGAVIAGFPLDTTGKDYSFSISVNGVASNTISLPSGKTYASADELAADLKAQINLDDNLKAAKAGVTVSYNSVDNRFEIVSNDYGASSNVELTAVGADAADLGLSVSAGVKGTDVAGTIDGVEAFGYGNILLPALGSKAEGLQLVVNPGATTATLNFSRGFSSQMATLLDGYTKSSGLIKNRETNLNKEISKVKDDQTALDRRTEAYKARLQAQFSAMESIVRSLNATSSSLDNIANIMPFTAKSGN